MSDTNSSFLKTTPKLSSALNRCWLILLLQTVSGGLSSSFICDAATRTLTGKLFQCVKYSDSFSLFWFRLGCYKFPGRRFVRSSKLTFVTNKLRSSFSVHWWLRTSCSCTTVKLRSFLCTNCRPKTSCSCLTVKLRSFLSAHWWL